MKDLKFLPAARRDLTQMREYAIETWGEARWLRRLAEIEALTDRIRRLPRSGRPADWAAPGLRAASLKPHVLFYRDDDDAIIVFRVLHSARDMDAIDFAEGRV